MNDYILLIAAAIVCCSLVAVFLIYLHYRRVERNCNKYIVKYIHAWKTNAKGPVTAE